MTAVRHPGFCWLLLPLMLGSSACDHQRSTPGSPPMVLGRTVLLIEDDCGAPLSGASGLRGLILGQEQAQAWPVRVGNAGSIQIDLVPGEYRLQATLQTALGPSELLQPFVVPEERDQRTITISLSPEELDTAWELFRAGRFTDAETFLLELKATPQFAANPAIDNVLGWVAARRNQLGTATSYFAAAQGAGCTGTDALVGLAGVRLLQGMNLADAADAERLLTEALERPGEYRSAPRHDQLGPVDLRVARAFARWLQGNAAGARTDLESARPAIATDATDATQDLFNLLQLFLDN